MTGTLAWRRAQWADAARITSPTVSMSQIEPGVFLLALRRMPELPDVVVYIEALQQRILGHTLERIRIASPFLLRTTNPAPTDVQGRVVRQVRRVGKRIAIGFEDDLWLVLHLMIAGR